MRNLECTWQLDTATKSIFASIFLTYNDVAIWMRLVLNEYTLSSRCLKSDVLSNPFKL